LLRYVELRFRKRTIFISGSAAEFGSWGQAPTENFLARLSSALIDRNYRIATGFGLGIGGAVVSGAVLQIYSNDTRSIEQQLVLRPFPVGIKDLNEKSETYNRYHMELVGQAGIALFFLGNKLINGSLAPSDGMRAEFELAKKQGLKLVPIGSSEYSARELWNEVISSDPAYQAANGGNRSVELMRILGQPNSDPMVLLEPLLELIALLSKD
jgi:hypothetical protein